MKTIFDQNTRDELITRINLLDENNTALWGKMNVNQVLKHCILFEEMLLGKTKYKRAFLGYIFGKLALKGFVNDDSQLKRSTPTLPEFRIKDKPDFAEHKEKWISLIQEYENFSNHDFVHAFFGKMTTEQVGILAYKHSDHHLRQFLG